ncbi:hypothetical protein [Methylomicrobium sp. Wu6]|uniref:hypothetical protein n=1 Tax=Methylomicrobium sp. Wu6 TaxID=3107928 RepID=UPI002DD62827|nr:hypothetical protein [Methylomicrobium sp. Wu6]MEC4749516.1 hypothetical protein [Methylomicrobium sp. Wu6]
MIKITFSDWLRESLQFIGRGPVVWFGCCLVIGLLMPLGHLSLALGVLVSVGSLFVGVGVAKYIDLKYRADDPVALSWAIKKSLPLAILAAGSLVFCWGLFRTIAGIAAGDWQNIAKFFFDWEFTPENLQRQTTRELAIWLFGYANVALIFCLLMMNSFASWFSYPLMLFRNYGWSAAKEEGRAALSECSNAFYKMQGFIFLQALLCLSVTPLLTPVLYMLTSTMMYVSYQSLFGARSK